MKLIVDTNVLISAIIKDSATRKILLSPYFEFYVPEFTFIELERHFELLKKKAGLSESNLELIIRILTENIDIISESKFQTHVSIAFDEMKNIDEYDAPFLALALSFSNDGIWSDDKHLKKQKLVRVWTTRDMLENMENYVFD